MASVTAFLAADPFAWNEFGSWAELVCGEVEQVPRPEAQNGPVCPSVLVELGQWSRPRNVGFVVSNGAGVVTEHDPGAGCGSDVLFVPMERCPGDSIPSGIDLLPGLVVESCLLRIAGAGC